MQIKYKILNDKNIEVENFRDKTLSTGQIDRYEIITEKIIRIWKSIFPHIVDISFKQRHILLCIIFFLFVCSLYRH